MIPLISSLCYGPLGVCQLPRFWWKVLLRQSGLLDEEYPDCSRGLDQSVLDVLQLDKATTLGYLRENLPNYLEFEAWVLQQKQGTWDQEAVAQWNASVRTRLHTRPEKIAETYKDIGFSEDVNIQSAVILNCLQDWQLFYRRGLESGFDGFGGVVVPLISSLDYGPLQVCQLPRTWLKVLLRAQGHLHPDYPDMTENGLDPRVLRMLGIPPTDAVNYIRAEHPSYLEFEAWVFDQVGVINEQAREEWNQFIRTRVHSDAKRAEIHRTVGRSDDGTLTSGVILNHIEDWHLAYAILMQR